MASPTDLQNELVKKATSILSAINSFTQTERDFLDGYGDILLHFDDVEEYLSTITSDDPDAQDELLKEVTRFLSKRK